VTQRTLRYDRRSPGRQSIRTATVRERPIPIVQEEFLVHLRQQPMVHVVSVDWVEAVVHKVVQSLGQAMLEAWTKALESVALEMGWLCPACEKPRRCKRRPRHPMTVKLLGFSIDVPKLYLECGHCSAPGVSVTKLLTGLRSGDASGELRLSAAYLAAEHSYGKASRDLGVHHGQAIERTQVRRLALEVEQEAMVFADVERRQALAVAGGETQPKGVELLMLQGDGGSVRTGTLVPCEPGDPGFGKTTASKGRPRAPTGLKAAQNRGFRASLASLVPALLDLRPVGLRCSLLGWPNMPRNPRFCLDFQTGRRSRRKRLSQNRELITLDVREPGQSTSIGLDVVVPCQSQDGERARRMLALAVRKGLGQKTQMIGLGDMGSSLPTAFNEAFVGQDVAFYSTDWKHICDYIRGASTVLVGLDIKQWCRKMRGAIWERDIRRRDELLEQARGFRLRLLPAHLDKCPLDTLATYLSNNWQHMQAARLKALGVDYVSARAEAQVRDRTKSRFSVPGAWREENLEPKATLRSVIAEGRWECFREHYLKSQRVKFERGLQKRIDTARAQKRLAPITSNHIHHEARDKAA